MQDENYIRDLDEWDPKFCEIEEEVNNDFKYVVTSIKANKEITRILKASKRNKLLDPIIIRAEANGFIRFIKEQSYYLEEELKQQAKEVIKSIWSKIKKVKP